MPDDTAFLSRDPYSAGRYGDSAPARPVDAKSAIDSIAVQSRVPANVLQAFVEATAAEDDATKAAVAARVAEGIAPRLQAGESIEDVILGSAKDEASARQFLERARQIGFEMYPDQMPKEPGALSRLGTAFEQGEATAITQGHDMARDTAAALEEGALGRTLAKMRSAVGMDDENTPEQRAEAIREAPQSEAYEGAKANLQRIADEGFKVKDWRDIRGLASLSQFMAENVATSLPQMGATLAAGPLTAPVTIALLGGEANQELKDKTDLDEGDRVAVALGAGTAMWALETIGLGKVVGGLVPSEVAQRALRGELADHLVKSGIKRSAARVIEAGIVEGSTEALQEGIVMASAAAGGGEYSRGEVMERLATAFAAGSGAGAGIRTAVEPFVARRPEEPEATPEPEPEPERLGLPAPAIVTPPPSAYGEDGTLRPQRAAPGSLASAMEDAPGPVAPGGGPGDPITLMIGRERIAGRLTGDNGILVTIEDEDTGEVLEIPREEFDSGVVSMQPRMDDETVETQATSPDSPLSTRAAQVIQPPAEAMEPEEPATADEARRRAAVIAEHAREAGWSARLREIHEGLTALAADLQAQEDAAAPAAQETPAEAASGSAPTDAGAPPAEPSEQADIPPGGEEVEAGGTQDSMAERIGKKNGDPFGNAAAAKRGLRARGLDPEAYEIIEAEGGVFAVPKVEREFQQPEAPEAAAAPEPPEPVQPQPAVTPPAEVEAPAARATERDEPVREPESAAEAPQGDLREAEAPQVEPDDEAAWQRLTPSQREGVIREAGFLEKGGLSEEGQQIKAAEWADMDPAAREALTDAAQRMANRRKPSAGSETEADALRRMRERGAAASAPSDAAADEVTRRDGSPFGNEAPARRGVRAQGADPEGFTYEQRDGGVVALRRTADMDRQPQDPTTAPEGAAPQPETPDRQPAEGADPITAAAADADPEPTDAEKEAGNYRLGHARWNGFDVSIENAKGSERRGTAPDGSKWSVTMPAHYGYLRGTEGADGDHVDVYLGDAADSDTVLLVDQQDPDTGEFDEHKAVVSAPDATAAAEIYMGGFSDGRARERVMGATVMSVDEFKAWLKDGDQAAPAAEGENLALFGAPEPDADAAPEATGNTPAEAPDAAEEPDERGQGEQPAESENEPAPAKENPNKGDRIEDFGERIEGAAKDIRGQYLARIGDVARDDVAAQPLSKSFPEPNYQALIDEGVAPWTVAFIRAARDAIPNKPRAAWKLDGWASQVATLREAAEGLLNGRIDEVDAKNALARYPRLRRHAEGAIDLYQAVGHERSLKGLTLAEVSYSMKNGQVYNPPLRQWEVSQQTKATGFSNMPRVLASGDTKEAAIEAFRRVHKTDAATPKAKKGPAFKIYRKRGEEGVFIGVKAGRDYVDLKRFETAAAARGHLNENQDDLVAQLERMRDIPAERKAENSPRVGVDHRAGADVTPEVFGTTFGFRGVQFGNWVENARRQADLNEAYDALLDLAGILGIPPRALSLNGELGLAFGARGKGGKNPAAAHYEPGQVVINLTKRSGAGSLAHEWFHALDNAFERGQGRASEYVTQTTSSRRVSPDVRPEIIAAFRQVAGAIRNTEIPKRSKRLDQTRTKDYWSTTIEVHARAFESYVIAKLQDQGGSNDYLANIVDEGMFQAEAAMRGIEGDVYPYATAAEVPAIRDAFDDLFRTIRDAGEGPLADAPLATSKDQAVYGTPLDIFYSPVLRAIEGAKQASAQPKDWKAILAKGAGVKRAELDWLGVDDWLDAQTGQVSREALGAFVRGSQISVHEEIGVEMDYSPTIRMDLGDVNEDGEQAVYLYDDVARHGRWEAEGVRTAEGAVEAEDEFVIDGQYFPHKLAVWDWAEEQARIHEAGESDFSARWGEYTEPGGGNYREVLLRMPNLHATGLNNRFSAKSKILFEEMGEIAPYDAVTGKRDFSGVGVRDMARFNELRLQFTKQMEADRKEGRANDKQPFAQDVHFEQENIVVHARVKDRAGANGERVLFVEEIQSDLGSKWRDAQADPRAAQRRLEVKAEMDRLTEEREALAGDLWKQMKRAPADLAMREPDTTIHSQWALAAAGNSPFGKDPKQVDWIKDDPDALTTARNLAEKTLRWRELRDELLALGTDKSADPALPRTPFENENYYALMVKRLLRMAAEEGYDRLAWTPGYMQAERWNQAAQSVVEGVRWGADAEALQGEHKGGKVVSLDMGGDMETIGVLVDADGTIKRSVYQGESLVGKTLGQLVGPSLTQEILSTPAGSVSGQKIAFPDSGYAIAYDQHIRKAVDKLAKKHGARATIDKGLPDFNKSIQMSDLEGPVRGLSNEDALRVAESITPDASARWAKKIAERGPSALFGFRPRLLAKGLEDAGVGPFGQPIWSVDITDKLRAAAMEPMAILQEPMSTARHVWPQVAKDALPRLRAELDRLGLRRVGLALDESGRNRQGAFEATRFGAMDILIGASLDPDKTLYHESIHAMRAMNLFSEPEWAALSAEAEASWVERFDIEQRYSHLTPEERTEEAIAEAFAEYGSAQQPKHRGIIRRALDRIARLLRAIRASFGDLKPDDVFMRAFAGEIGARQASNTGIQKLMESRSPIDRWRAALVQVFSQPNIQQRDVRVSSVGPVLRHLGVPDGTLHMSAAKVRQVAKQHPEARDALMQLPALLADPDAVISQNREDSDFRIVTSARAADGRPIVANIKVDGQTSAGQPSRIVMTVHGWTDWKRGMKNAAGAGSLVYLRDGAAGRVLGLKGEDPLTASIPSARRDGNRKVAQKSDVLNTREQAPAAAPAAAGPAPVSRQERKRISQIISDAMGGQYGLLSLVPGRPLFAELAKAIPSAQQYLRSKEEMDAMRQEWQGTTDEVAQAWRKLISQNGEANKKMMDLMHRSTIAGVDPSAPFKPKATDQDPEILKMGRPGQYAYDAALRRAEEDRERFADHRQLRREFSTLPESFQEMFRKVRDTYSELADGFDAAVLANVEKSMVIAVERAERRHRQELQRIDDEGLTGAERKAAIEEADDRLMSAKKRNRYARNARLSNLRATFEMNRVDGPYFPLSRFGDYFATVRDAGGKVISFSRFEKEREQTRFAEEQRKVKGQTVEIGVLDDSVNWRDQVDPGFVADIEELLGSEIGDWKVMDAVWQRWLETMPDFSARKRNIHRKGTAGYDIDAFRAFGRNMFHGAHQLARLTHAVDMQQSLERARDEATQSEDPNRNGMLVNEMQRRHDFTMNPTGSKWAQFATSAAFTYYLGVTPAAAFVNLTQTTVVGIPVLSAGFPKGSVTQATRQLGRAAKDFFAGGMDATAAKITGDERRAMEEAYRRGTIDKTQAHDLAGVAETGVEYSATRMAIMSKISFLFHHTERANREITYLAAYRMARAHGLDHDAAIDKAADLTWKTHFDYQNTSRPRALQNDVAKVALVFRNFQINMLWRLFRDTHQAVKGKTAIERREARTQLIGITSMMMLHAGITGTWGYALIKALVGLFFDDGGDDVEEGIQSTLIDLFGPNIAGMMLKGVPGHLTGIDLTHRIGMPELWFRSPDRQLEGDDLYNYWMAELLGAVPGIVENSIRGIDKIGDGEVWRGIETAAPKFVRDLMQAGRYAVDGVTTYHGDPLLEDVNAYQIIVEALGFTPAEISERYDQNSRMKNKEMRIEGERRDLMRAAGDDIKESGGISPKTLDKIADFNREYPEWPIRGENISRSLRARIQASDRNQAGIALNTKLNRRIRDEAAPGIY